MPDHYDDALKNDGLNLNLGEEDAPVTDGTFDAVPADLVYELERLTKEARKAEADAMMLRKTIANTFFPTTEGSHTLPLSDGSGLKLTITNKVNRTIDEAVLQSIGEQLREARISTAMVIKMKPELKLADWRKLSPEQHEIFDQCITEKEGSPSFEVKRPKGK